MSQEIQHIKISELHLWTENPRDPIDTNATDVDIIKRAIEKPNSKQKWNLEKLINEMGDHYDLSELPTVVKDKNKYIVYDGNRRMIVLKYAQNPEWTNQIEGTLFPTPIPNAFKTLTTIPCNVCDKRTALDNIERKHTNSGSWKELERNYFLHNHRGQEKSNFLIIEESTEIISKYPKMNQRFVSEEIFTIDNLNKIGFDIQNKELVSNYSDQYANTILKAIVELVENKNISTRGEYRRKLLEPLKEYNNELHLKKFDNTDAIHKVSKSDNKNHTSKRKTKRQKSHPKLFGKELYLEIGKTNNIYRDISDLYDYYCKYKDKLSRTFPNLIRMSLRLLVESASKKSHKYMDDYIKENFEEAKNQLDPDPKTTLRAEKIDKDSDIIKLLNIGAHDYESSSGSDQTLAMSLIIGSMLTLTHSKDN